MEDLDKHRQKLPPLQESDGVGSLVLREVLSLRNQVSEWPQKFRADLREELLKLSTDLKNSQIWDSGFCGDKNEDQLHSAPSSFRPGSSVMIDGAKLALPFHDKPLKSSVIEKPLHPSILDTLRPGGAFVPKRPQESIVGTSPEIPPAWDDLNSEASPPVQPLHKPIRRHSVGSRTSEKTSHSLFLFRDRESVIPAPPEPPSARGGSIKHVNPIDNHFGDDGSFLVARCSLENGEDDDHDRPELKRSQSGALGRNSLKGNKKVRSQAVLKLIGEADEDEYLEDVRGSSHTLHSRMRRVVLSPVFDSFSALLVLTNAITIGMQTDDMAKNSLAVKAVTYRVIDTFFCIAFSFELLLRMIALGGSFFYAPDWTWNMFDVVLVGTQIAEEIFTYMASGASDWRVNFSFMRILRILRLVRIMRLIRILRLIGELRTIVSSLLGSMKSLMWTIFLLFVIVYVFAVYLTQLVSDVRVARVEQGSIPNKDDQQMFYLFGSLGRSIFTLYQAISGGLDWNDIAEPLMDRISLFLGFVLAAYTAFCLLALMNVVTGVFVEAALEHAKKDRAAYMLRHVRELFAAADPEHTGYLNYDRFMTCLDYEPMQNFFKAIDVDVSEAQRIFALLDGDDSGSIELDEFLNGCLGLHGPAQAIHLATLMHETRIAARYSVAYMEYIGRMIKKLLEAPNIDSQSGPEEDVEGPAIDQDLLRRKSFMAPVKSEDIPDDSADPTTDSTSGPTLDPKLKRRKSFAASSSVDMQRSATAPEFSSRMERTISIESPDSAILLACMDEDLKDIEAESSDSDD